MMLKRLFKWICDEFPGWSSHGVKVALSLALTALAAAYWKQSSSNQPTTGPNSSTIQTGSIGNPKNDETKRLQALNKCLRRQRSELEKIESAEGLERLANEKCVATIKQKYFYTPTETIKGHCIEHEKNLAALDARKKDVKLWCPSR